jgi:hypothetical protein
LKIEIYDWQHFLKTKYKLHHKKEIEFDDDGTGATNRGK